MPFLYRDDYALLTGCSAFMPTYNYFLSMYDNALSFSSLVLTSKTS